MQKKERFAKVKILPALLAGILIFSSVYPDSPVAFAAGADYASMERSQVPSIYKWNLALTYRDTAAFLADKALAEKRIAAFKNYSGKLKTDAQIAKALEEYYGLDVQINRLYGYAVKFYDTDARNNDAIGLKKTAEKLFTDFGEAVSFLKPELLKLPEAKLKALSADKRFEKFDVYLSDLAREKPHILSGEEESLLAKTGNMQNAPYNIYDTFSSSELPYKETTLTDGTKVTLSPYNYVKYRQSASRDDRKIVFENFFGSLSAFKNTLAETLSSQVEANIFRARAEHFNTALDEALFSDDLPASYYKNLVDRVNKELPLLWRYLAIKKKALGAEELNYYDLYAPITSSFSGDYSYEEGEKILLEAVKPLGDEYGKQAALTITPGNGRIDIYPNLGKASGAYSSGDKAGAVPYILMNYDNSYDSVSALVHELGHSVHSYFSNKNQSYLKTNYSTLIAETASTFNENLLLEYMLKNETDPEKRKELLGDSLEMIRGTLFRQAMFAEFELDIYTAAEAGTPLTAEFLNGAYLKLVKKYYGDSQGVVKVDDAYAIEWAYVPHFYYDYYVINYVAGYLNGLELSEKALANTAARDKYINMLKAGSSKYPPDLLKTAGVDPISPAAYDNAFATIEKRVAELEKLEGIK